MLLSSLVRGITHDGREVTVAGDRCRVSAARAVIAIPPTLAGRPVYTPTLTTVSGDGGLRDQLTRSGYPAAAASRASQ